MSAPSQARFLDIYGNDIGSRFINVGWFFSDSALLRTYNDIENIPEGAHSVIMYEKLYLIEDLK